MTCSCGFPMAAIQGKPGYFQCVHCDGPCHKRCADDADCDNGNGNCPSCNAFDIGSRPKRLANWMPPAPAA